LANGLRRLLILSFRCRYYGAGSTHREGSGLLGCSWLLLHYQEPPLAPSTTRPRDQLAPAVTSGEHHQHHLPTGSQTAGPLSAMLGSARAAAAENRGMGQRRLPVDRGCVSEHVAGGHHAMTTPADGGDRDSEALIRTLYHAHGRAVLAYISQLTGDRYEAQDVLQETMLRAWRHQQELVNREGSVRGWLLTVAKHVAVDRARARLRRPQEVAEAASHAAAEPDRVNQVIDSIVVYEAMQKLSEEQREVLILLRFQGRSVREVAEVLGVPEGTVKSRAYHALQALRKWLGENL
jgi:RNA polymerase sigma-70 factor (ECF subfamily)